MSDAAWFNNLKTLKGVQAKPLPELESHDLSGQTFLVTGANTGIGYEIAKYLASHNASKIILACRNPSKGTAAAASLASETGRSSDVVESRILDLTSFQSVKAFAGQCADLCADGIDVAFMNAGMSTVGDIKSEDGFDTVLQANHLGATLLTLLLYPLLSKTTSNRDPKRPARIVWTSSNSIGMTTLPATIFTSPTPLHTFIDKIRVPPADDHDLSADYYAKTKLWAYICSLEYARRVQDIDQGNTAAQQDGLKRNIVISNGCPGFVKTQLGQKSGTGDDFKAVDMEVSFPGIRIYDPEEGARTITLMGTYPVEKVWAGGGGLKVPWFVGMQGRTWEEYGPEVARDEGFRKRVWEDTMRLIGVKSGEVDGRFL